MGLKARKITEFQKLVRGASPAMVEKIKVFSGAIIDGLDGVPANEDSLDLEEDSCPFFREVLGFIQGVCECYDVDYIAIINEASTDNTKIISKN